MLRLLVILGLIVLLYFLIRKVTRELRGGSHGRELEDKDQMIQDPVCRVYVPRGAAVEEKIGGQTYYFCSKQCAQTFQKQLAS
jgi:YHS domain-containing protein